MSDIINSAPLLSPLRSKGNTFITFSSTLNDLNKPLATDDTRMFPTKAVVLNLPKWANTTDQSMYIDPAKNGNPLVPDPNTTFPKFIQNYIENQIQYSESDRTDSNYSNYSEVAFWKALQKLGCMTLEENGTDTVDGDIVQLYKEIDEVDGVYEHVVKGVFDVNMTNLVAKNGVEYAEYYAYIPSESGKNSNITFGPTDVQHTLAQIPDGGGDFYTTGLGDYTDQQNYAIYDTTDSKYNVGDDLSNTKIRFDLSDIENESGDYEFNALLLYYDLYETTDETTLRTNAFGLLLMDRFEDIGGGTFDIPRLKKYQPDDTQPGNSYIFKIDHRMATNSNQTSNISFNTYNNVSMEMYMNALRRLTSITEMYNDLVATVGTMSQKMDKYDQFLLQYDRLEEDVDTIESNTKRIQKLEAANRNEEYIRLTNEELFDIFYKTTTAVENAQADGNNVNIEIVASSKTLFPTIIDPDNLIAEDSDGNRYEWDTLTEQWEQIGE